MNADLGMLALIVLVVFGILVAVIGGIVLAVLIPAAKRKVDEERAQRDDD